jgi:S-adenosyl-L-methionine hydrolase (adenosine-forming)
VAYDWVWLLTDYGRRDGFVAACHGVIARIAPAVRVEDITHEVPACDARHAAVVLAQTVLHLPLAVIVGVVDPGVGTQRRGVAIRAGGSVLVGPDNGLLGWAADALGGASAAVELTEPAFRLPSPAHTFEGRDVFAPAAAHLAAGVALDALGPAVPVEDLVRLAQPRVEVGPGRLDTEVLTIDRFGNVQLAASMADLAVAGLTAGTARIGLGGRTRVVAVGVTFADVAPGELVLYVDSAGQLALAVNGGDAAAELGLESGDPVTVTGESPLR